MTFLLPSHVCSLTFGPKSEPSHVRGVLRVRRRRRPRRFVRSCGVRSPLACKSRVFGAALNWI